MENYVEKIENGDLSAEDMLAMVQESGGHHEVSLAVLRTEKLSPEQMMFVLHKTERDCLLVEEMNRQMALQKRKRRPDKGHVTP